MHKTPLGVQLSSNYLLAFSLKLMHSFLSRWVVRWSCSVVLPSFGVKGGSIGWYFHNILVSNSVKHLAPFIHPYSFIHSFHCPSPLRCVNFPAYQHTTRHDTISVPSLYVKLRCLVLCCFAPSRQLVSLFLPIPHPIPSPLFYWFTS